MTQKETLLTLTQAEGETMNKMLKSKLNEKEKLQIKCNNQSRAKWETGNNGKGKS